MLNRRIFFCIVAGTLPSAAYAIASEVRADAASERASAFVKATGEKLIGVVNGPGSAASKRQALTQVIDSSVDINGVGRFCLGRFWRQASADQRRRYLASFREVLVSNITSKLGDYQGVKFTVNRAIPDGENVNMDTTVERPHNPPTNVKWVIGNPGHDPQIIDVIAEGTSLRLTQRSDYAAYLAHNSNDIDALITAMREQVERNRANG